MRLTRLVFVQIVLFLAAASPGLAQDPPELDASLASGGDSTTPASDSLSDDALRRFNYWASQQQIYTPPMIADMRQRLRDRFATLSPADQQTFHDDVLKRLNVFEEPLAQDATDWALQTLAVASDSYASTVRAKLPDIVDDTADEMRVKFRALALRRLDMQRYRAGFDQTRQANIASLQDDARRQAAINSQLRASMSYSSPNLYTPGVHRVDASARYQAYFNQRYANPFSYAFGGVWFF